MVCFDKITHSTAFQLQGFRSGAAKSRVVLKSTNFENTNLENLLNIHCQGTLEKPELSFLDKFRWTAIQVKNADNSEVWLKVNKESLRKRLGMSKKEFALSNVKGIFNQQILSQKIEDLVQAQETFRNQLSELNKIFNEIQEKPYQENIVKNVYNLMKESAIQDLKSIKNLHPYSSKFLSNFCSKTEKYLEDVKKHQDESLSKIATLGKNFTKIKNYASKGEHLVADNNVPEANDQLKKLRGKILKVKNLTTVCTKDLDKAFLDPKKILTYIDACEKGLENMCREAPKN